MPRYNAVFSVGPVEKPIKQYVYFHSPDDAKAQAFANRLDALIDGVLTGVNKQILDVEYNAGNKVDVPANVENITTLFKTKVDGDDVLTKLRYKFGTKAKTDDDIETALEAAATAGEIVTVGGINPGPVLTVKVTKL